jgi:hypothetical protein
MTSNRSEIKAKIADECDAFTFHKDGTITMKWSYFYRFDRTPKKYAEKVKGIFPDATIIDTGDQFHGFVGGSKCGSSQDSYMWVQFKVN